MHTAPMPESTGTFDDLKEAKGVSCRKCNDNRVLYKIWESSCGGYEDYKFECKDCGHTWWVDGPDA